MSWLGRGWSWRGAELGVPKLCPALPEIQLELPIPVCQGLWDALRMEDTGGLGCAAEVEQGQSWGCRCPIPNSAQPLLRSSWICPIPSTAPMDNPSGMLSLWGHPKFGVFGGSAVLPLPWLLLFQPPQDWGLPLPPPHIHHQPHSSQGSPKPMAL